MDPAVFWTVASAVFAAVAAFAAIAAVVATAVFGGIQIAQMRGDKYANAFIAAVGILQDHDTREARTYVFERLEGRAYNTWGREGLRKAAEVCQSYDVVAQMVRNNFLQERHIVPHWAASLAESWDILSPFVAYCRERSGFPWLWNDYEWLATLARSALASDVTGPPDPQVAQETPPPSSGGDRPIPSERKDST